MDSTVAAAEDVWADRAKRLLRAEMVRRGVTYDDLAARLESLGVHDTPVNLRNKVARGRFMALFMLQCMDALGAETIRLQD